MIDVKKKEVKDIMEEIHKVVMAKAQKGGSIREDYVKENRVFQVLCEDSSMEPRVCAEKMNSRFGYSMNGHEVIELFRDRRISNRVEREELFQWARQVAEYFGAAVNGSREAFEKLELLSRKPALKSGKEHNAQGRLAAHMIFYKFPELDVFNDLESLCLLGNTYAKYLFIGMVDVVSEVYDFSQKKGTGNAEQNMTYEQALRKIAILENSLERTNTMLQDLQKEFEEQLEESRIKELTDFFAKLNSEKYGCILDELLQVRKGAEALKKSDYELPLEINGMLIMVKKLIQFVKDSHIEPVMKLHSIRQVIAADIEFCNYEGTPFSSKDEVKTVKVISPGWIYRDKEIQIARPKVKEEKDDE